MRGSSISMASCNFAQLLMRVQHSEQHGPFRTLQESELHRAINPKVDESI